MGAGFDPLLYHKDWDWKRDDPIEAWGLLPKEWRKDAGEKTAHVCHSHQYLINSHQYQKYGPENLHNPETGYRNPKVLQATEFGDMSVISSSHSPPPAVPTYSNLLSLEKGLQRWKMCLPTQSPSVFHSVLRGFLPLSLASELECDAFPEAISNKIHTFPTSPRVKCPSFMYSTKFVHTSYWKYLFTHLSLIFGTHTRSLHSHLTGLEAVWGQRFVFVLLWAPNVQHNIRDSTQEWMNEWKLSTALYH